MQMFHVRPSDDCNDLINEMYFTHTLQILNLISIIIVKMKQFLNCFLPAINCIEHKLKVLNNYEKAYF